jgi:hypothetical protein
MTQTGYSQENSLPEEHLECTFIGDKIALLTSDKVPSGGFLAYPKVADKPKQLL